MYSMKEACVQTGMSYETLKFYCKEGLVPNVKRDSHNYRVFDDRDIKWIQSLGCLKRCSHQWKNCRKPLIISTGNRIFTMMSCRAKSNITAI